MDLYSAILELNARQCLELNEQTVGILAAMADKGFVEQVGPEMVRLTRIGRDRIAWLAEFGPVSAPFLFGQECDDVRLAKPITYNVGGDLVEGDKVDRKVVVENGATYIERQNVEHKHPPGEGVPEEEPDFEERYQAVFKKLGASQKECWEMYRQVAQMLPYADQKDRYRKLQEVCQDAIGHGLPYSPQAFWKNVSRARKAFTDAGLAVE